MISGFALVSMISFILCIVLSITIYFKKVKYIFNNDLSKIFVLLCISLALFWALIEFGYRSANDFTTAYYWLKLNVAWYFVMSFLLHFSLLYTENHHLLKKKITYLIIYGPAIIFFFIDISTNLLLTKPVLVSWGWTFGIPTNPIMHSIPSTWAAFTALFCFYIILDYLSKLHNINKKKQTRIIIFGICIPIIIGLNTEWLFPILNIRFPELIVPALTFGIIIICYGIWIYSPLKNKDYYEVVKTEIDKNIKSSRY